MLTITMKQDNMADLSKFFKLQPCDSDKIEIRIGDGATLPTVVGGNTLIVKKKSGYSDGSLLLIQIGKQLAVKRFHAYPDCVVLQDPKTFETTHYGEKAVFNLPVEPLAEVLGIVKT